MTVAENRSRPSPPLCALSRSAVFFVSRSRASPQVWSSFHIDGAITKEEVEKEARPVRHTTSPTQAHTRQHRIRLPLRNGTGCAEMQASKFASSIENDQDRKVSFEEFEAYFRRTCRLASPPSGSRCRPLRAHVCLRCSQRNCSLSCYCGLNWPAGFGLLHIYIYISYLYLYI